MIFHALQFVFSGSIGLTKKFVWYFRQAGSSSAYLSLTSFGTILLDCIVTVVTLARIKKTTQLVNFCVVTSILKMEEKKQYFWLIMLYCFKKGKMQLKCREKICTVYGEGAVTG